MGRREAPLVVVYCHCATANSYQSHMMQPGIEQMFAAKDYDNTTDLRTNNNMEEKYQNYLQSVKDSRDYNNILFSERRLRLPFIDAQTGVAQVDSCLWRSSCDRQRPIEPHRLQSTLYRYPAMRWQKRRRDYLLKDSLPSYSDHSLSTSRTVLPAANTRQVSPTAIHHHSSSQHLYSSSSTYSSQQTSLMRSQASVPSRADSTGSHSCHTVDSDSRDLSIATSQSFDSPARDDSPQLSTANGYHELSVATARDTRQDLFQQNNNNEERLYYSELTTSQQQQQQVNGISNNNHATNKQLEDQTKAAIKLHSKMNKKKNIGQSLMKLNNSILVKSVGTGAQLIYNHHHQNDTTNDIGNNQQQHVINYNTRDGATSVATVTSAGPEYAPTTDKSLAPRAIISNGSNRPFVCSICDQTYKTRPGLSYHFIHTHNTILPKSLPSQRRNNKGESNRSKKRRKRDASTATAKDAIGSRLTRSQLQTNRPPAHDKEQSQRETVPTSENKVSGVEEKKVVQADGPSNIGLTTFECHERMEDLDEGIKKQENGVEPGNNLRLSKRSPICDFCNGTKERNRRTGQPEKLISCASCGCSGHPSCLKFTDVMTLSVLKYDWQCMDCKTCRTCNNADNEAQLMFCDGCDRSYHTYCLSPPLVEPPEGNWSCELCMLENHDKEPTEETIK